MLAQTRKEAVALFGPVAAKILPEIPLSQIRKAMREALPEVLAGLRGDERNVLLTLARMWQTARSGRFVTKGAAADWASQHLDAGCAATLDHARKAYLGEIVDDWKNRGKEARQLAEQLRQRIASFR